MTDSNGFVAYKCSWCGQSLHELPDDNHSMAPRAIYTDYEGNQYCERYCRDMATKDDEANLSLPELPQRQDSLIEQLVYLCRVATRLGMYDATDALVQAFGAKMEQAETRIRYGCHVDLGDDEEPDGCVIEEGQPEDCIYAATIDRKEHCKYWRIVVAKRF